MFVMISQQRIFIKWVWQHRIIETTIISAILKKWSSSCVDSAKNNWVRFYLVTCQTGNRKHLHKLGLCCYDFATKNSSFRNLNFEIGLSLMSAISNKWASQKWSRTTWSHACNNFLLTHLKTSSFCAVNQCGSCCMCANTI